MTGAPSFTLAMSDPEAFGPAFERDLPTFTRWCSVLDAAQGHDLDPEQRRIFAEVSGGRTPPTHPVRELWAIVGRRGGKTRAAALIGATLAIGDYDQYLAPGQRAEVAIISTNRDSAKQLFNYTVGLFETSPRFAALVEDIVESRGEIRLKNRVSINVRTASFRSIRGSTLVAAVLDEIAFWFTESTGSANPDHEILRALRPALATIPTSMIVGISSPYAKSGVLYEQHRQHFGQPSADTLVIQGSTRQFNETVSQSFIDNELEKDPDGARAEYLGEFRADIANLFDAERVEACVDIGIPQRAPQPSIQYHAFVDPSGGSADAQTLAIGHLEDDRVVIDLINEWKAPFSPDDVISETIELLRSYRIFEVTGDRYGGVWCREPFEREGINYHLSQLVRSDLYLTLLPCINGGRVRLVEHRTTIRQLSNLERRTARSGKDSIDHPRGGHDDAANAVAGVTTVLLNSVNRGDTYSEDAAGRCYVGTDDPFMFLAEPMRRPRPRDPSLEEQARQGWNAARARVKEAKRAGAPAIEIERLSALAQELRP